MRQHKTFLVGLMGYAGVGKDAIAAALGFPTASFAKALKDDLRPLLEKAGVDLNDRAQKDKVRQLLVEYGRTMRKLDQDYWVKRIVIPDAPVVVITDLRYVNEAKMVLSRGPSRGIVVWVVRPGVGPANAEEETSIDAVLRTFNERRTLHNISTVKAAAEALRTWIPKQPYMEVQPQQYQRCGNVSIGHASPMRTPLFEVCNCARTYL